MPSHKMIVAFDDDADDDALLTQIGIKFRERKRRRLKGKCAQFESRKEKRRR